MVKSGDNKQMSTYNFFIFRSRSETPARGPFQDSLRSKFQAPKYCKHIERQ
jgi:hypothetical protein